MPAPRAENFPRYARPGNQAWRTRVTKATSKISACREIITTDFEGNITYWNARAECIFGFSQSEATGQSLRIIIPERLRERPWSGLRKYLKPGHTPASTWVVVGRLANPKWVVEMETVSAKV